MFEFDGQVVIVTGSGSAKGIGKTIAKSFVEQGASVVIADMNEEGVNATVEEIKAMGGDAMGVVVYVTNKDSVDAMVQAVLD